MRFLNILLFFFISLLIYQIKSQISRDDRIYQTVKTGKATVDLAFNMKDFKKLQKLKNHQGETPENHHHHGNHHYSSYNKKKNHGSNKNFHYSNPHKKVHPQKFVVNQEEEEDQKKLAVKKKATKRKATPKKVLI